MTVNVQEINRQVRDLRAGLGPLYDEMEKVIVGQRVMLDRLLAGLLTGGHILLEGVPGLAKTLAVRTLAQGLRLNFSRIQFTPDLLPADVIGTQIYNPRTGEFTIKKGPIFANLVLADEVNRAPAKVQSALLEAMQEKQVTIGDQSYRLEQPFLVMATQNPIEQEGTYPLPEAQVDRFMMKVLVDYPEFAEEVTVVQRSLGEEVRVDRVLGAEQLEQYQRLAAGVYVDRQVQEYAVALATATRRPAQYGLAELGPFVAFGASPRGPINLVHAARALALLRGRTYALPQDVQTIARDVLRHRIVLTYEGLAEGATPDRILDLVLRAVPAPRIDLGRVEEAPAVLARPAAGAVVPANTGRSAA